MSKTLNIAIAGLGTVGSGVVDIINHRAEAIKQASGKDIVIYAVSARNPAKKRDINLPKSVKWVNDPSEFLTNPDIKNNIDIIVELIGGDEGVAKDLCFAALASGVNVVTANKALISKYGYELAYLAEKNNAALLFEGAVAGGVPVIKNLKECLIANDIYKITGILNGTCNFILSKMADEGSAYEDVLKEAQNLGYAEADPSFDVGGIDASHKISILAAIAYNKKPSLQNALIKGISDVSIDDINYSKKLGYNMRLIAMAKKSDAGDVMIRVEPCMLPRNNELGAVNGVLGGVRFVTSALGNFFMSGAGAGRLETASSVISDIVDIACGRNSLAFGKATTFISTNTNIAEDKSFENDFYLRFRVKDETGVLKKVTDSLNDFDVGIERIFQDEAKGGVADILIITHEVLESKLEEALESINGKNFCLNQPIKYRIEQ